VWDEENEKGWGGRMKRARAFLDAPIPFRTPLLAWGKGVHRARQIRNSHKIKLNTKMYLIFPLFGSQGGWTYHQPRRIGKWTSTSSFTQPLGRDILLQIP
jgi:hypothetical protein